MANKEKGKTKKSASSENLTPQQQKDRALETVVGQITKNFGEGSIMKLGDTSTLDVSSVSTGSLTLDLALGIGGVPKGRIIEIFGPESSGKTTLALHIVAEVQKTDGYAAFIDAEHALDPVYARALEVNIDELLVSQPDSGEQALEIAESLVRSNALDVLVIDSVAALVPQQEIDGEMGDSHVGLQARLMSQAMRKLASVISKSNCVVVFINQLREKIGVVYGNPEVTTGGRALKFYASVRIEIRKTDVLKNGSEIYGNRVKCKVVKNKVAPPFKTAEFDILYGKGISKLGELVDVGAELDIIDKSGSWFSYDGLRLGQGRDNARKYLEENPDVAKEIEDKIRAASLADKNGGEQVSGEDAEEAEEEYDEAGPEDEEYSGSEPDGPDGPDAGDEVLEDGEFPENS